MSLASDKIERVSAKMILSHPWYASLFLRLRRVETERVDTMAVDGRTLFFSPKFTESLSDYDCQTVLMHEVLHCALLHITRRNARNPLQWNIACDAAVNAVLVADGRAELPNWVPPAPLNVLAEEIYDDVKVTEISMQDLLDGITSPEERKKLEGEWKESLARVRGLEPAGLKRAVDETLKPKRNWREELARFIYSQKTSADTTWRRPSRRIPNAPGKAKEPNGTMVLCVDTSGSVDNTLMSQFLAECRAIASISGFTVTLLSADAVVTAQIAPGEPWPPVLTGGGGTDFRPAITAAEELEPDCVVYFTDGFGEFPDSCTVPVLWVLTGKEVAVPFGYSTLLEPQNTGEENEQAA